MVAFSGLLYVFTTMILNQQYSNGGSAKHETMPLPPSIFILGANAEVLRLLDVASEQQPLSVIVADENLNSPETRYEQRSPNRFVEFVAGRCEGVYQIEYLLQTALKDSGGIDIAINNFQLPVPSTIIDSTANYTCKVLGEALNKIFLFIKYETALLLGRKSGGTIINIFHGDMETVSPHSHATYTLLHAVKGITNSVNQSYNDRSIRAASYLLPDTERDAADDKQAESVTAFELGAADSSARDLQSLFHELLSQRNK